MDRDSMNIDYKNISSKNKDYQVNYLPRVLTNGVFIRISNQCQSMAETPEGEAASRAITFIELPQLVFFSRNV